MKNNLDSKAARDLVGRAIVATASEQVAKKMTPSIDAMFELVRETTMAESAGKRGARFNLVKVSVGDVDDDDAEPVTTVFKTRTPIDAGPKKRTPIRTGGGTCITVKVGPFKVTVCVEWES